MKRTDRIHSVVATTKSGMGPMSL